MRAGLPALDLAARRCWRSPSAALFERHAIARSPSLARLFQYAPSHWRRARDHAARLMKAKRATRRASTRGAAVPAGTSQAHGALVASLPAEPLALTRRLLSPQDERFPKVLAAPGALSTLTVISATALCARPARCRGCLLLYLGARDLAARGEVLSRRARSRARSASRDHTRRRAAEAFALDPPFPSTVAAAPARVNDGALIAGRTRSKHC